MRPTRELHISRTSSFLYIVLIINRLRKKRGLLVASSTNTAIIAGFVASAIIFLIVLAAYGGEPHVGVWRICFGIGIIVSSFIHGA